MAALPARYEKKDVTPKPLSYYEQNKHQFRGDSDDEEEEEEEEELDSSDRYAPQPFHQPDHTASAVAREPTVPMQQEEEEEAKEEGQLKRYPHGDSDYIRVRSQQLQWITGKGRGIIGQGISCPQEWGFPDPTNPSRLIPSGHMPSRVPLSEMSDSDRAQLDKAEAMPANLRAEPLLHQGMVLRQTMGDLTRFHCVTSGVPVPIPYNEKRNEPEWGKGTKWEQLITTVTVADPDEKVNVLEVDTDRVRNWVCCVNKSYHTVFYPLLSLEHCKELRKSISQQGTFANEKERQYMLRKQTEEAKKTNNIQRQPHCGILRTIVPMASYTATRGTKRPLESDDGDAEPAAAAAAPPKKKPATTKAATASSSTPCLVFHREQFDSFVSQVLNPACRDSRKPGTPSSKLAAWRHSLQTPYVFVPSDSVGDPVEFTESQLCQDMERRVQGKPDSIGRVLVVQQLRLYAMMVPEGIAKLDELARQYAADELKQK
jgi:hypothetical protein